MHVHTNRGRAGSSEVLGEGWCCTTHGSNVLHYSELQHNMLQRCATFRNAAQHAVLRSAVDQLLVLQHVSNTNFFLYLFEPVSGNARLLRTRAASFKRESAAHIIPPRRRTTPRPTGTSHRHGQ